MDGPMLAPLWALLHSDRFQAAVADLAVIRPRRWAAASG